MTLLKPSLQVRRLRISQGGSTAYEESFHPGVNIVRGKNSAGKTTILDALAYSMGAENIPWKPEALLCDQSTVELSLNGVPVTLRRPISDKSLNSMMIFWGEMEASDSAPVSQWEQYPFKRSGQKESFSQVLFRALELPEVRGAAESNITMHQVLRLLYADQRSPHESIFRAETFDTVLTRETVGNYLFGVYDDQLYDAQLKLKQVESELDHAIAELRHIFSVLGRSGQETNFEWIDSQVKSLQDEQGGLHQQLMVLKSSRGVDRAEGKDPGLKEIRQRLSEAKKRLAIAEDGKAKLDLEIEDSVQFIDELQRRVDSLDESGSARTYLGSMHFAFCPCCLSKITENIDATNCELCKSPLGDRAANSQLLRMKNELELQREESKRLLSLREKELFQINAAIPSYKAELRLLEREYGSQSHTWSNAVEGEVERVAKKIGETEQRIRQLVEFQKLGAVVGELQGKRAALAMQADELKSKIEKIFFAQEKRKEEAKYAVVEDLIRILRADMPRQAEFANASVVDWSFGDNKVSVNGRMNFSESSMVILRHSFHLAMLFASTKHAFFRLPRFLILDGIEDGGLELERSHHFQRLIVDFSKELKADFQLIFGTSQIAPSLGRSELVVGRSFTPDNKSLSVK